MTRPHTRYVEWMAVAAQVCLGLLGLGLALAALWGSWVGLLSFGWQLCLLSFLIWAVAAPASPGVAAFLGVLIARWAFLPHALWATVLFAAGLAAFHQLAAWLAMVPAVTAIPRRSLVALGVRWAAFVGASTGVAALVAVGVNGLRGSGFGGGMWTGVTAVLVCLALIWMAFTTRTED